MRRPGLAPSDIIRADLDLATGDIPAVQSAVEQLQRRDGLVKRHFVTGLVDPGEGEVAVLAGLAVLDAVDEQGGVAGFAELGGVRVVRRERDRLAAEPVADVIRVAIDERDAHGVGEDGFEVIDEVGPDVVAGLLEGEVDFLVAHGVVEVYAQGVLDRAVLEVFGELLGWGGVICWMTDIIHPPFTDVVVGTLDVIATHVRRLSADSVIRQRRAVGLLAQGDLVLAAIGHTVGELHVVVHGLVDALNTVGIVHSKFGVMRSLDAHIDDTIDNTQRFKVQRDPVHLTRFDFLVLLVEVVEELPWLVLH